jgi:hypothetical protein
VTHSLDTSTAKLHDSQVWDALLHGEETSVWADKGYVSAEREAIAAFTLTAEGQVMNQLSTADLASINAMVRGWYRALDTHEPVETLMVMLAPEGLKMVFPEATLQGTDAFVGWYEGVIRIFFDETHEVQTVSVEKTDGRTADIKVVVRWAASRWNPPSATSDFIDLLAYQSWSVVIGVDSIPRIATYTVDRLDYLPGSARL